MANQLDLTKPNIPQWQLDLESSMQNYDPNTEIMNSVQPPGQMQFDNQDSGRGFFNKQNSITGETTQGWGMPAIQGIGALAGSYLGYQQLKLGQSQLEQNKKIFNLNFGAQAQTLNTRMEDRQRSMISSAGTGADKLESVDAYMAKHAIKTQGI